MNVRQTTSCEVNPDGAIKRMQTQTPNAHDRLMSSDDLRLTIRMMSGMLKSGNTAAATTPIELIKDCCSIGGDNYGFMNLSNCFIRARTRANVSVAVLFMPKSSTLNEATVVAYKTACLSSFSCNFLKRLK